MTTRPAKSARPRRELDKLMEAPPRELACAARGLRRTRKGREVCTWAFRRVVKTSDAEGHGVTVTRSASLLPSSLRALGSLCACVFDASIGIFLNSKSFFFYQGQYDYSSESLRSHEGINN